MCFHIINNEHCFIHGLFWFDTTSRFEGKHSTNPTYVCILLRLIKYIRHPLVAFYNFINLLVNLDHNCIKHRNIVRLRENSLRTSGGDALIDNPKITDQVYQSRCFSHCIILRIKYKEALWASQAP